MPQTQAVKITVAGVPPAMRRFSLIGARLRTWRSTFGRIALEIAKAEAEWFDSQGEGTWAALTPDYAARKAVLFPGKPILVATEDLRKSLTSAKGLMQHRAPDVMILGSDVKVGDWNLAELHQYGTKKMVARKPLIPISRMRAISRTALAEKLAADTRGGI